MLLDNPLTEIRELRLVDPLDPGKTNVSGARMIPDLSFTPRSFRIEELWIVQHMDRATHDTMVLFCEGLATAFKAVQPVGDAQQMAGKKTIKRLRVDMSDSCGAATSRVQKDGEPLEELVQAYRSLENVADQVELRFIQSRCDISTCSAK